MQKLRVLLAEDDDALRRAFRRVLEARGMEVVGEAANGAEAVAMAQSVAADVVLTDLRMPIMDGIEATRQIMVGGPPPIVIILSAYADPSLQEEARAAGAIGWLQKGCSPRELCEKVYALAQPDVVTI
jgi:DNA-binding NarL/FixJ family response regulator